MASLNISDALDARLRAHLGGDADAAAQFVEQLVRDQLDHEDDPAFQAQATARIKRGMANFEAGRSRPAKQALHEVADELGLDLNR